MRSRHAVMVAVLLLGSVVVSFCVSAASFSGTIFFRDGTSVPFTHLGGLPATYYDPAIYGRLGSVNTTLLFSELREIILATPSSSYAYGGGVSGDLVVISSSGNRFTLTDCLIGALGAERGVGNTGDLYYVYTDPITNALRATRASVTSISHIVIGDNIGSMKLNPLTGEYFPAVYNYDPFTGERLIWAKGE